MQELTEILTSEDFWKIVFPAVAAIVAWVANERSKLGWEQYKRKEESYKELLRCLKGFYVASQDKELKGQFLHQINLLWLYAPDHVIRVAYAFLETVKTGASSADQAKKERAFGEFVAAIRKDILSRTIVKRTSLEGSDFRHFVAN